MSLAVSIVVFIVLPAIGVLAYAFLCVRMSQQHIPSAPFVSFFLLFATYGTWLIIAISFAYGLLSGMHSLGALYLLLFAPPLMVGMRMMLREELSISGYHRAASKAAFAYFILWSASIIFGLIVAFRTRSI